MGCGGREPGLRSSAVQTVVNRDRNNGSTALSYDDNTFPANLIVNCQPSQPFNHHAGATRKSHSRTHATVFYCRIAWWIQIRGRLCDFPDRLRTVSIYIRVAAIHCDRFYRGCVLIGSINVPVSTCSACAVLTISLSISRGRRDNFVGTDDTFWVSALDIVASGVQYSEPSSVCLGWRFTIALRGSYGRRRAKK